MKSVEPATSSSTTAAAPPRLSLRALGRRGPMLSLSLVIALSAGMGLAQVLQQPAAPPAATGAAPRAAAPAIAPTAAAAAARPELVTVERGDLQASVDAAGKLQLYKYVDVSAQIAGQVKEVLVAVGDPVKAGAMLIEIVPTVLPAKVEIQRAQMARLQAELADQRAQLDYAELQFKRQSQLKEKNATREDAVESSRMGLASASARVDAIHAQIRQVEANLKIDEEGRLHAQVVAPIAGTVVAMNAHPGQPVGPGTVQVALLRIADVSRMTVQARVAEIDVTRLRKGMAAQFTTPGLPGQRWSGKLRQVMPIPADNSGEQGRDTVYNVVFDVANPDQQLMSGMSARVRFIVGQAQDTLLLPARALGALDADGVYSVSVIDGNGKPTLRRVKTGMRNSQQVQVLSGLAEGEQVIVARVAAPPLALRPAPSTPAPVPASPPAAPELALAAAPST
ncbi:efflux RND transporter periplasmic adaptor subunit [Massilia sp. DWR3-1-1]|uniref:efflux RND transporter periplasmic adaptor subunit n=1 Tax=Massilia sp. DWR3-1-1 TaxID=2804559 RepID=UPI003CECBC4C